MSKRFFYVCPGVFLLAVATLCTSLSAQAQVLYSENFDHQPDLIHLSPGSWRTVNGVLQSAGPARSLNSPGSPQIQTPEADWVALGDPSWHEYTITFDFQFP